MSVLALGIPLTAVTLLGLLLNLYIILVVILSKQVHTANNLLLLHLGVVDVCVGAVLGTLLLCGGGAEGGASRELPRAAPCSLPGFLLSLLHPVALWTLCGLHTDRYFAISTPLHYGAKVSTRKVLWGLAVSWLGSLMLTLLALLPACGVGLTATPTMTSLATPAASTATTATTATVTATTATPSWVAPWTTGQLATPWAPWAPWGPVLHAGIYTATTLLLPATIVLVCNLKVLMIARHHRHRIASAIFEVTLSAQVTITHQRNPFVALSPEQRLPALPAPGISPGTAAAVAAAAAAKFRNRSALCPVLQLMGSLVLLYFPYYGLLVWDALAASNAVQAPPSHFSTLAICLITCSPPVNGLLYGVKNKVLRKTIQNYWRKQMSKSEMNQEIQARTPSTCGSRRPSLTPAGLGAGLGSSTLQRRLSEIVLEPLRSSVSVGSASPRSTSKLQRIASDLLWRPSQYGLGLGRSLNSIEQQALRRSRSMRDGLHHSSNTLQIPSVTSNGDLPSASMTTYGNGGHPVGHPVGHPHGWSGSGASPTSGSLFVQRVLSTPRHSPSLLLASVSRRSPRILITRAFSEESDGSGSPSTGTPIGIQHSASASTLPSDRRWRRIRYRDQGEDASDAFVGILGAESSTGPCSGPPSGPPSDESSSPTEQRAPSTLNGLHVYALSDGETDEGLGVDGNPRPASLFSTVFSPISGGSPISSPELPELPELPEHPDEVS